MNWIEASEVIWIQGIEFGSTKWIEIELVNKMWWSELNLNKCVGIQAFELDSIKCVGSTYLNLQLDRGILLS